MTIALSKLSLLLTFTSFVPQSSALHIEGHHPRDIAPRFRATTSFSNVPGALRVSQRVDGEPIILETDEVDDPDADALINFFDLNRLMSMPTGEPSDMPSDLPSDMPSDVPSDVPSNQPTDLPSSSPTLAPTTLTPFPTVSMQPSLAPSVSQAPSPSLPVFTELPSSTPSFRPTQQPTSSPTIFPSSSPSATPSASLKTNPPTGGFKGVDVTTAPAPSATPSAAPSIRPTIQPSSSPSAAPTLSPSAVPSSGPTQTPTVQGCAVSAATREANIMAILDTNADSALIRDPNTVQGMATEWLLDQDSRTLCPDTPKILQRWVLAVIYFATNGDQWIQCSNNIVAQDSCGADEPFVDRQRFLTGFHECDWAGIDCKTDPLTGVLCVTEIEFELNNLNGFIPSEIGLLTDLERWGMERGGLTGTIPTEIENLSNLVFLDLDYNELTGTLTTQLLSLIQLEQLDLNNNLLTGNINGIGVFSDMVFFQLHDNQFSGDIPSEVGALTTLEVFTIHETFISGDMPQPICDLLGLELESLIADCGGDNPNVNCDCCTECRAS